MRIKQYEEEFGGNFRHYSMLQNVFYCIGNAAHCCFPLLIWCMIAVFINVAIPVLSTWLPNVVIETITAGYSLRELVVVILGFMGGLALLSGANQFFTKFIYFQKYRMNTFYVKQVTLKGLTTDYCNQENGSFRKFQTESVACCSGNYSPLSNVYEVLIRLLTGVVGMTIFGVILIRLDGRILLLLITTALISYFLNQKNLKWMEENNSEKIGYQQRLNYISRTAGDIRPAKDIRLYGMKEWFSKVYQSNMNGLDGWYRRLTVRLFGTALYDGGLALLRESMIYLYLLFLVFQNRITVADFVLYFGIVTGFSTWLDSVFLQILSLNQISLRINYFRSYMEYPESYCRKDGIPVPIDRLPKVIELKHVSYRYEGGKYDVLHDINLKILPGESASTAL